MVCTDSVIDNNVQLYNLCQSILIIDSPPGTEVIGKGRHVFPFSFQIPVRYVVYSPFLDYLVLVTTTCCHSSQKNPINFQSLHRKSCSQAESGTKAVDEADKNGQNSLYICVQTKLGSTGTDGEKSLLQKCQRWIRAVVFECKDRC